MKQKLTIFTCTYNRIHTIERTYESLLRQTCKDFIWLIIDDGSTDNTKDLIDNWIKRNNVFEIQYVYKENGGLHTGYNKAIELMETELCVCIDSDDYMPLDAVENIISFWIKNGSNDYAGIVGLDYYTNGQPIGGEFPSSLKSGHIVNLYKFHSGDVKMVHRTELLKKVAPMSSFPGEKFANPIYLFIKVDMMLPMLFLNKNLCYVEYQDANNSMSKNILYQYIQSPNSFKRLRMLHMSNQIESYNKRFRHAIHYVSCCLMLKDKRWFSNSPMKISTIAALPFGILLYLYIKIKTHNNISTYK